VYPKIVSGRLDQLAENGFNSNAQRPPVISDSTISAVSIKTLPDKVHIRPNHEEIHSPCFTRPASLRSRWVFHSKRDTVGVFQSGSPNKGC
jgi:hypothetical protein